MPFTLPDWLPLRGKAAKRRALRLLRGLVQRHIDQRHAQQGLASTVDRSDLLQMLLALRDESTGEALSHQEVFDQCMVSFQAGHETIPRRHNAPRPKWTRCCRAMCQARSTLRSCPGWQPP